MLIEIDGDVMSFQTLTRSGKTADSGSLRRQETPKASTAVTTQR